MSIHPSIRRAETARELDRGTWAGLDKIDYKLRVESGTAGGGEALVGPFWFGRAFDAPPFFTFSATAVAGEAGVAPQLTIGVAEWLQDEQNMYVGANLWFKCALCWEPIKTGGVGPQTPPWDVPPPQSGAVFKEDFEDWQTRPEVFGGPEGNEIVAWGRVQGEVAPSGYYWPSQRTEIGVGDFAPPILKTHQFRAGTSINDVLVRGPVAPYTFTGYYQPGWDTYPRLRTPWHISNANPKSGGWHMRCIQQPLLTVSDFSDVHVPFVRFATVIPCKAPADGGIFPAEESGPYLRANPGMSVWVGCDAMVDNEYDQTQSQLIFSCQFFNADLIHIGSGFGGWFYLNGQPSGAIGSFLQDTYSRYDRHFYLEPNNGDPDPNTFIDWPGNPESSSFSEFSNSEILFLRIMVAIGHNPVPGNLPYPQKIIDIDNLTVDIIGAGGNNLPTKFDVTLNFSGQLLKGYAAVHPLRSYEHPAKVILS